MIYALIGCMLIMLGTPWAVDLWVRRKARLSRERAIEIIRRKQRDRAEGTHFIRMDELPKDDK